VASKYIPRAYRLRSPSTRESTRESTRAEFRDVSRFSRFRDNALRTSDRIRASRPAIGRAICLRKCLIKIIARFHFAYSGAAYLAWESRF